MHLWVPPECMKSTSNGHTSATTTATPRRRGSNQPTKFLKMGNPFRLTPIKQMQGKTRWIWANKFLTNKFNGDSLLCRNEAATSRCRGQPQQTPEHRPSTKAVLGCSSSLSKRNRISFNPSATGCWAPASGRTRQSLNTVCRQRHNCCSTLGKRPHRRPIQRRPNACCLTTSSQANATWRRTMAKSCDSVKIHCIDDKVATGTPCRARTPSRTLHSCRNGCCKIKSTWLGLKSRQTGFWQN